MPSAKAKSLQAQKNTAGHKSRVATLNDITKAHAVHQGEPWDDRDVGKLAGMIAKNATTFEMAMELGRTFYSAQTARSHVRFAMNHARVFRRIVA